MGFFSRMRPSGERRENKTREARREAAGGRGTQTVFSKRKDKVELIGLREGGRADKNRYHKDYET